MERKHQELSDRHQNNHSGHESRFNTLSEKYAALEADRNTHQGNYNDLYKGNLPISVSKLKI